MGSSFWRDDSAVPKHRWNNHVAAMHVFKGTILFGIVLVPALAAAPPGERLLSDGLGELVYYDEGGPPAVIQEVPVTGQSFGRAVRVDTFPRSGARQNAGLIARMPRAIRKDDVLWVSFSARCLTSTRETGEASFELRFDQLVEGKYRWPAHLDRGISVGHEWAETSIPFRITKDVTPDDVRLVLEFDHYPQRFEIGPISFINYGPDVKPDDLPRSVVRYHGGEADAPWREAAASRVEQYRKGNVAIHVTDSEGRPLADVDVRVRMRRLAFNLGTAISSARLLEPGPDGDKYREMVEQLFNQVVFDNEMKWPRWADPKHDMTNTIRALDWLEARGIPARGHVMVWPSWRHLPPFMSAMKDDRDSLRRAVLTHIARQTDAMRGRFAEWDVTNELFAHHDLLDAIGWEELAAWYRAAHAGDPNARLYYNEYTMFHADGPGSPSEHFFQTVRHLTENDAPVHGIGEQAHIGGTPPGIPLILERLDRFAALGLPIAITEFDINSNDDEFKARYLRDFMTAVFSHPSTSGIVQWGFWEGYHWFPVAALFNKDWTLRKHGEVFVELVTKTWRTDADLRTSSEGTSHLRAFCGEYDVTISRDGSEVTRRIAVTPAGTVVDVRL